METPGEYVKTHVRKQFIAFSSAIPVKDTYKEGKHMMKMLKHTYANNSSRLHPPNMEETHKKRKTKRGKQVKHRYGVATVSRIDKIIGFFCRISSLL